MILDAARTNSRKYPRPVSKVARAGLTFEKKFHRNLYALVGANTHDWLLERNPWFEYRTERGTGICCPDILLIDKQNEFVLVMEVKQTWVPDAITKLRELYCPVVQRALKLPTQPIVIVKNVTPDAPRPQPTLSFAAVSPEPLYQWLGQGPIII